ncbi:response regulator [Thiothrix lacustris]|uniref:histidine kinase n=1 Tax=Thiothrix lacustris TaxID=525917 RepID=A0ABY9MSQ9_9GAMM|nr:response regulator [Thiothrix lacustris]WML91543.1 response regulator [Thiothrix lacustris]
MNSASTLADVLEDVALQLSSLNPLADSPEDIAATAANVIAEYQRISAATDQAGMDGIHQTAEWIQGMLASFQQSLPEAILELLQGGQLFGWIELTAAALREPEDHSHLPAIAAELTSDAWPEPSAPEMLENLLISLRVSTQQPEVIAPSVTDAEITSSKPEQNSLTSAADIHPELLEAYLQETPGQITETSRLIHLISQGDSTPEQRRHAARLAHTVKGASGVVGVKAIASFTHRLEDILEFDIAKHLPNGLGKTLAAAADCLETLFEHLQEHKPLPDEYALLLTEMDEWEQRITTTEQQPEPFDSTDNTALLPSLDLIDLPDFITRSSTTKELDEEDATPVELPQSSNYLSVPMETVQRLLNLAGELITSTSQIAEQTQHTLAFGKQLQQQDDHVRQMLETLSEAIEQQSSNLNHPILTPKVATTPNTDFDQLELEAYNDLYSASNLLTESIADNRELTRNLQQQIRQISDQVYQQQRLQRQLSETILRTRLVPIKSIVTRMERTVRETCRRTDKLANINIIGQNLQIDTDILQGLIPPLLHMLRNAVDHGIETPDARETAGKPVEGNITLSFEQKGNQIHLTLQDDGQGLDAERIRSRAIERGLLKPDAVLSEEDTQRLILQPGFTTRDQVSDISGRGVGMDVVQTAVENLQGLLHIRSKLGQGTTLHIQVPLTLIATNALLVRTSNNLIAIPSNTIQQLLYVSADEHTFDGTSWQIQYQDHSLEVLALSHLLGWQTDPPDLSKGHSLLIVESEQKTYALHVEEILQPRDIVVKNLLPWLNLTQGISGACILANGAVAPVLDLLRMLRNLESGLLTLNKNHTSQVKKTPQRVHILIVDDSLSNRKSLSLMVEQMGYQAITAIDGLEALQHLNERPIAIVLTDLEMPRMNGLEMTQAIRIWPEKRHLPIIMITSRSTKKHQQMAEQVGVDAYLTKPVDYDTLNAQLYKWLKTQLAA